MFFSTDIQLTGLLRSPLAESIQRGVCRQEVRFKNRPDISKVKTRLMGSFRRWFLPVGNQFLEYGLISQKGKLRMHAQIRKPAVPLLIRFHQPIQRLLPVAQPE